MANNDILDNLFRGAQNKLSQTKRTLGTQPKRGLSKFLNIPTAVGVGGLMGLQGSIDTRKYLKSLGEYGEVADPNKSARQIVQDFNSLYFKNNKSGVGDKGIETIMKMAGLYNPPTKTATIEQPSKQQQLNQVSKEVTGQVLPIEPDNQSIDTLPALPILPRNAVEWDRVQIATPGASGLPTNIPPELYSGQPNVSLPTNQVGNRVEPLTQNRQQVGPSLDDLLALAQADHLTSSQFNQPYITALQSVIDSYNKNQEDNFYRDLYLAAQAGLGRNSAYAQMIGGYDKNKDAITVANLVKQLGEARNQQAFNPLPIMGNVAVANAMGLSPITAMANPDLLKIYSTMYGQNLGYTEAMNRLRNETAIANMLEAGRTNRAQLDAQLNRDKMELERWKQLNPTNQLPAQAQLIGSLINAASFNPAMRDLLTPEFLNYATRLTGYTPSIQGIVTPQQQAQAIMNPNTRSGLNIPTPPRAR